MIIEFTGLPGSGKTYICEKLEIYLKKNIKKEISIYNTNDIAKIKRKLFCKRYKLYLKYITFLFRRESFRIMFHLVRWKVNIKEFILIIRWYISDLILNEIMNGIKSNNSNTIFLIHEGLVHRLHAIYVSKKCRPKKEEIITYIKNNDNSELIIVIYCTIDKSIERLQKRDWIKRIIDYPFEQKVKFINNFYYVQSSMLEVINTDKVIPINNNDFKSCYDKEFKQILGNIESRLN